MLCCLRCIQFSSVQSLSCVRLFATPWIAARQASLSITNSQSLPKLRSIKSVMPSNHLILCHPLLLLPSIFPGIRVFSNESALRFRWPKYWSFSFNISPSNEHPGMFKGLLNKMEYVSLRSGQDYSHSLVRTYSLLWCSVRFPRYSHTVDSLVLQCNLWLKTSGRVKNSVRVSYANSLE